jgi:hypothetical protein
LKDFLSSQLQIKIVQRNDFAQAQLLMFIEGEETTKETLFATYVAVDMAR